MRLIDVDTLQVKLGVRYCKLLNDVEFLEQQLLYAVFNNVDFEIEHAPTVDTVTLRHGKWYWDGTYMECTGWRCSECGEFFADSIYDTDGYRDDPMNFPSKYCPNCGAKMDGENADNTPN